MTVTIGLIVTFFNNKFSIEILRNIIYFVIADCIYMLSIRLYFSCCLHHIKLLFVIKMSHHHTNKIIKFHHFILPP